MSNIAQAMFKALSMIKGFDPGMSSSSSTHLIVDYDSKRYLVVAHEIENPEEDMFKDIKKYISKRSE